MKEKLHPYSPEDNFCNAMHAARLAFKEQGSLNPEDCGSVFGTAIKWGESWEQRRSGRTNPFFYSALFRHREQDFQSAEARTTIQGHLGDFYNTLDIADRKNDNWFRNLLNPGRKRNDFLSLAQFYLYLAISPSGFSAEAPQFDGLAVADTFFARATKYLQLAESKGSGEDGHNMSVVRLRQQIKDSKTIACNGWGRLTIDPKGPMSAPYTLIKGQAMNDYVTSDLTIPFAK